MAVITCITHGLAWLQIIRRETPANVFEPLSPCLSFLEDIVKGFFPLLSFFTSINFVKVTLINFARIEGQSYYYQRR